MLEISHFLPPLHLSPLTCLYAQAITVPRRECGPLRATRWCQCQRSAALRPHSLPSFSRDSELIQHFCCHHLGLATNISCLCQSSGLPASLHSRSQHSHQAEHDKTEARPSIAAENCPRSCHLTSSRAQVLAVACSLQTPITSHCSGCLASWMSFEPATHMPASGL